MGQVCAPCAAASLSVISAARRSRAAKPRGWQAACCLAAVYGRKYGSRRHPGAVPKQQRFAPDGGISGHPAGRTDRP